MTAPPLGLPEGRSPTGQSYSAAASSAAGSAGADSAAADSSALASSSASARTFTFTCAVTSRCSWMANLELAQALERLAQLNLAAVDLEALRCQLGGDVSRGDGAKQMACLARLAGKAEHERLELGDQFLGLRLLEAERRAAAAFICSMTALLAQWPASPACAAAENCGRSRRRLSPLLRDGPDWLRLPSELLPYEFSNVRRCRRRGAFISLTRGPTASTARFLCRLRNQSQDRAGSRDYGGS